MKTRSGFVSNSSSSSFLVMMKKGYPAACIIDVLKRACKESGLDFDDAAMDSAADHLIGAISRDTEINGVVGGSGYCCNDDDEGSDLLYNLGECRSDDGKFIFSRAE